MAINLVFINGAYVPEITSSQPNVNIPQNTQNIQPTISSNTSYLPLSGGTMTGIINMNGNNINNVATVSATSFVGTLSGNASGLSANIPESKVNNLTTDLSSKFSTSGGTLNGPVSSIPQSLSLSGSSAPYTLSTNAALSNNFNVTLTHSGNFLLENPIGAVDGQNITWRFTQGSGNSVMSLDTQFHIPSSGPASLVLSTSVGTRDIMSVKYNASVNLFEVVAFVTGY